ncbi:ferrochelatase [Marivirga arenosa]|uniref:Ferrochelatase n=1 Tax=Marivirga arenosa TaxID=3059076 RepID=A0AA52EYZ3_9BACT|nr:ferrochelatase [Marivirga sp. BKB1-2]WNB18112.1 ferrochelatase [Marivirga sp. BKB1-2]
MNKANQGKTGVLLVNLGTPDSTKTGDVRKYLREFLMDKRVIDFPFIFRWMLVNLIIAPFRAPKSAKEYRKLWVERGSPLKFYGEDVAKMLQEELDDNYVVALGMRYQSPSIKSALEELRNQKVAKIIVIPLFPQYASATSGSVHDKVMEIVQKWQIIPQINFISTFVEEPGFYKTFAKIGKRHLDKHQYDHVIFSYHGLPERQIRKGSVDNYCKLGSCCNAYHDKNRFCYRAQCFQTSRLIAKELNLSEDDYTVTFQSRLGNDPWIKPYTDDVLKDLAKEGKKSVLAYSPAFVADCLETTIEVGEEFKEEFEEAGGERWDLVESLNDDKDWVLTLKDLVLKN